MMYAVIVRTVDVNMGIEYVEAPTAKAARAIVTERLNADDLDVSNYDRVDGWTTVGRVRKATADRDGFIPFEKQEPPTSTEVTAPTQERS